MIAVEIRGATELARKIAVMRRELDRLMLTQMQKVAKMLESYIRATKLSGDPLRVRTGHLRRNLVGTVKKQGYDIHAVIGVRDIVPYARIHELGGEAGRQHRTIIPARPYLVPGVEEKREEILQIVGEGVQIAKSRASL